MGYPVRWLEDRNKSAQGQPGGADEQRIGRIVVPSLALVAACGAALVFGIMHVRRETPVETRAATAAPAVSPPASGARDEGSAALATAQAEANAVAAAPAVSPRSPDTDESGPVFDIARIEPTGATRSSRVGLRQARSWNCCATASALIKRSQINPDNSSCSLPGFPPGLRTDVEVQRAGRQAGNIQTERGGRVSRGGVQFRRGLIARRGAVQCSGDGGGKPFRAGSGRWGGRTFPFHSCRPRLPPLLCQTEARRPPWSCPGSRPRSYPVATASGASAVSPTARACDTQSFTRRTGTKSEIQIVFIPARFLSFL
jgi:hypothetical protein